MTSLVKATQTLERKTEALASFPVENSSFLYCLFYLVIKWDLGSTRFFPDLDYLKLIGGTDGDLYLYNPLSSLDRDPLISLCSISMA